MSGSTTSQFKENAVRQLADVDLRQALTKSKGHFTGGRQNAMDKLPEFDALRDQARDLKDHVLENLDFYLEAYEQNVIASGGQVHWARTAKDAQDIVLDICRSVGATSVNKGKSMIGEECDINEALEANGIRAVETDLGEYIIQIRNERPSHIIAPAVHLTKAQVEASFRETHTHLDPDRILEEPPTLLEEARTVLRKKYFEAQVGITRSASPAPTSWSPKPARRSSSPTRAMAICRNCCRRYTSFWPASKRSCRPWRTHRPSCGCWPVRRPARISASTPRCRQARVVPPIPMDPSSITSFCSTMAAPACWGPSSTKCCVVFAAAPV
jgi:hypothetical protein